MTRRARHLLMALTASCAPWLGETALAAVPTGAAAEILSLQGQGEQRANATADWRTALPAQALLAGAFVRTRESARMALLFSDETQVRLNQNTVLQVKEVASAASPTTTLLLSLGRAWAQTKRAPGSRLDLLTPAATAGIRGTDWDIEVGEDGKTLLTVFSGTVAFANDQGQVTVNSNEAAVAEVGKAPVKVLLSQPRDRIQWVNALTADPLRHLAVDQVPVALQPARAALAAGDMPAFQAAIGQAQGRTSADWLALLASAQRLLAGDLVAAQRELTRLVTDGGGETLPPASLLLSDLHLVQGDYTRAAEVLQSGLQRQPGQPDLVAQLARAQLLADRLDDSVLTLKQAAGIDTSTSLWLARGALARRQGDNAATLAAYTRATQTAPQDDRGWFGLGSAHTEREDSTPARSNLQQALQLQPQGPGYRGELGTLETFSNDFAAADRAFAEALAQNPSDYVALTGLGLLRLKQGQPAAALDAFLRAGVMEPRYARAKAYTAVAYWQLGRQQDAITTLHQASALDDKDPIPYMLLAQVYTDLFRAGDAVQASRDAVQRMPYLKSLNQLANDQQGRANFGASLAFFGLEDWALELAQQGNHPYWGGSHLFLADRYEGEFNKNSELFQGFLSDPLAFGASQRFSTLLQSPGQHGAVGITFDKNQYRMAAPFVTLNGLTNSPYPVAYFVKAQKATITQQPIAPGVVADPGVVDSRIQNANTFYGASGPADMRGGFYTLGLGVRPTERLGLFTYANEGNITLHGRNSVNPYNLYTDTALGGTGLEYRTRQGVAGLSYRWGPSAQTWVMLGRRTTRQLSTNVPSLLLAESEVTTLASDQVFNNGLTELQARHTVDLDNGTRLTLTLETMREKQVSSADAAGEHLSRDAAGNLGIDLMVRQLATDFDRSFTAVTLGAQHKLSERLRLEGSVAANDMRLNVHNGYFSQAFVDENGLQDSTPVSYEALRGVTSQRPFTPRLGVVLQPADGFTVRAAYQDWLRPLGVGTLGRVDTAGIPVEDRLVQAGGRHKRSVVQFGLTPDERTFLSARLDHLRVQNPAVRGVDLRTPTDFFLSELRSAQLVNLSTSDVLENTPSFDAGTVNTFALGANRMLTRQLSGYAKYQRQNASTDDGKRIPYLPRDTLVLGTTWASAQRLYLSARTIYRSQRFDDLQNRVALAPGWRLDLMGFWETADKRWVFGAAALNLGGVQTALSVRRYLIDARYRF